MSLTQDGSLDPQAQANWEPSVSSNVAIGTADALTALIGIRLLQVALSDEQTSTQPAIPRTC